MNEEREQLIFRINQILATKNFTEQAKKNLLNTIVWIYDCYSSPKYIKKSKIDFINEYLKVLENMNGYAIIKLDELNLDNEISTYFRESIKESKSKKGDLELVGGRYIPASNGSYYCSCNGFAWNQEQMMFSLERENLCEEYSIVLHEMTHLEEGSLPFPFNSFIPMSFEIRKMFYEGRATTRENCLNVNLSKYQAEEIADHSGSFDILSKNSYPLYGNLYQILQILFGDEILEELAKNNDPVVDSLQILKNRFPKLPVNDIFAHIIYILNCYNKNRPNVLTEAIHHCNRKHSNDLKHIVEQIAYIEEDINNIKNSNEIHRQSALEYQTLLENPNQLLANFEKEKAQILREIEESYQSGETTEEEYKNALTEFEKEGTLENYRSVQENYLKSLYDIQKENKEKILFLEKEIKQLQALKKQIEEDCFPSVLEQVCLKNPSLAQSFQFLVTTAMEKVQMDFNENSVGEIDVETCRSIAVEQITVLLKLQEYIVPREYQKNTSLVS